MPGESAWASFASIARSVSGAGLRLVLASIASLSIGACTSRPAISDLMIPFPALKSAIIKELPNGLRSESQNGRELLSGYFSPGDFDDDATDKPVRAYALVTILGAGRPYSIAIKVTREQKLRGASTYKSLGSDKKLAQELAKRFKAALADRREDRNVIDDFRAF
jgi:hypothetical protein